MLKENIHGFLCDCTILQASYRPLTMDSTIFNEMKATHLSNDKRRKVKQNALQLRKDIWA